VLTLNLAAGIVVMFLGIDVSIFGCMKTVKQVYPDVVDELETTNTPEPALITVTSSVSHSASIVNDSKQSTTSQ
jgi:hypothetical protein